MNVDTVVIGGGGAVGETLAGRLADGREEVLFLDDDENAVERAAAAGADVRVADPSEAATFDRADIEGVATAIVASREDSHNLLVAQFLRLRRAERVIALVNDPANLDVFAETGIEPVCAATALSSALDEQHRNRETLENEGPSGERTAATNRRAERERDDPERERLRSNRTGGGA